MILQSEAIRNSGNYKRMQIGGQLPLGSGRKLLLREIEGIAPYAFVCGYEWGYELLYSSGVIHDKLDWKALYQLLPLL